MKLTDLKTVLDRTNLPVAYGYMRADQEPQMPYITFELAYTSNFCADRDVYYEIKNVDIFLFTRHKDEAAEGLIQTELAKENILWDKTETYLPEQQAYQILYEVRI